MTVVTLEQIAKEPFNHIHGPVKPGFFVFKGLPAIKGCGCSKEFVPARGTIRTELMEAVANFCEKQFTNNIPAMCTIVGAGHFFDALQVIAIAQQAGLSVLHLDLFELKLLQPANRVEFQELKTALNELVHYLYTQKVHLTFNFSNLDEHIVTNLDVASLVVEEPILSVNVTFFSSTDCAKDLEPALNTNTAKFIMALDLVENVFNPFINLKILMDSAPKGSELVVANKAASRTKIQPFCVNDTVLFWHKIKNEAGEWLNGEYSNKNHKVGTFWAGFYARAGEGKGPSVQELAKQPYGPYYDRGRFKDDFPQEYYELYALRLK